MLSEDTEMEPSLKVNVHSVFILVVEIYVQQSYINRLNDYLCRLMSLLVDLSADQRSLLVYVARVSLTRKGRGDVHDKTRIGSAWSSELRLPAVLPERIMGLYSGCRSYPPVVCGIFPTASLSYVVFLHAGIAMRGAISERHRMPRSPMPPCRWVLLR